MAEWIATLGLIFGGCCSNALSMELITTQYAKTGHLITFAQFLIITLVGLRRQLYITPSPVTSSKVLSFIAERIGNRLRGTRPKGALHILFIGSTTTQTYQLVGALKDLLVRKRGFTCTDPVTLTGNNQDQDAPTFVTTVGKSSRKGKIDLILGTKPPGYGEAVKNEADIVIDFTDAQHPIILKPHRWSTSFNPLRIRLKRRHIPLSRHIINVVLFLLISLLNNAAFAFQVPMPVHIIFRSAGLVVNLVMGWLFDNKRYSKTQVFSVLLVTVGVALTTMSSMRAKPLKPSSVKITTTNIQEPFSLSTYLTGIAMLALALLLSSILGIAQDRTHRTYGRSHWEESMFYLHSLALPMFTLVAGDISAQLHEVNTGPVVNLNFQTLTKYGLSSEGVSPLPYLPIQPPSLRIPQFYIPLIINVLTQLVCVSGVNRLTAQVSSLTVTLVLAVRKATSLGLSILLLGNSRANSLLYIGATAVLLGTIGYAMGNKKDTKGKKELKKD